MTQGNAAGFFILGALMRVLPAIAPAITGARALDGSCTGALWLEFMGAVLTVFGSTRLLQPVLQAIWQRCQFKPRSAAAKTAAQAGRMDGVRRGWLRAGS
jgi:hypothetical protein